MYVHHAFGMQLVLVKIVHLLVKIARGLEMRATLRSKMWHRKAGGLGGHTFVLERQPES